jgi:N-acetylglucosaminyl-diphospho-decaprenol L-rhamnosyltransferase
VWSAGGTLDEDTGLTRTLRTRDRQPDWLSGACLAFRIDSWRAVGGFDPDYFMYWEDIDLSVRWRASGRPLRVVVETVVHDVGATQSGDGKSSLYVYYNCRNRLLFARNLSAIQKAAWARTAGEYARRVLQRGGRRALLRRAVPLTIAALRGTRDGRRMLRRAGE